MANLKCLGKERLAGVCSCSFTLCIPGGPFWRLDSSVMNIDWRVCIALQMFLFRTSSKKTKLKP